MHTNIQIQIYLTHKNRYVQIYKYCTYRQIYRQIQIQTYIHMSYTVDTNTDIYTHTYRYKYRQIYRQEGGYGSPLQTSAGNIYQSLTSPSKHCWKKSRFIIDMFKIIMKAIFFYIFVPSQLTMPILQYSISYPFPLFL